jgi:hypothetical protein
MYSCKTLPEIGTGNDRNCLNILARKFEIRKVLGAGLFGITLEIKYDKSVYAVKIMMKNQDAINEIQTACILNNVIQKNNIFTYTHGWFACNNIPSKWQE